MEVSNREVMLFGRRIAERRAQNAAAAAGGAAPQVAQQAGDAATSAVTHNLGDVVASLRQQHGGVNDQLSRLFGLAKGTETLQSPALTQAVDGTTDVLSRIRAMVDGSLAAHAGGAAVSEAAAPAAAVADEAADASTVLNRLAEQITDPTIRAQVLARVDQSVSQAASGLGAQAEGFFAQRIASSGISADDLGRIIAQSIDDVARLA